MPVRVPTYDSPKVQRANLSGGENTTRALPVAAGQTAGLLASAANVAADVGERWQQRRDLDEAFRVETQVMTDYSAFEQNLRKTRRGANAQGVVDDVDQWWAKIDDTYGKDVSPRVKELTKKSLARVRAQALESTGRYQMAEEDRAQVQSYEAVNGQEIQRAITNGKPEVIAGAKEKIGAAVRAFGAPRGWDADQVAAETLKWNNMLHTQAINTMVDQSPERAKEYFEANRSEIDSANHARIDGMLDKAVTERKATDNAANMASLPFEQAIEKAGQIADPDERKLTIRAIRDLQADKNTAISLREKAASDAVWQAVADGAPMGKLPRALLAQMDGKERVQVNAHYAAEQRRREAEAKGHAVKTDMGLYEQLMGLSPDEFKKVQFSTYADKISRGDMEQLINRKAALKDPKVAPQVATTEQQMNSYSNVMGLKGEKKGMFTQGAYNAFNQFRAEKGKEPDYNERQVILDRLATTNDGGWFSSSKKFYQAKTAAERNDFVNNTVPAEDRKAIEAEIKKRGKPVTVEAIIDMYNLSQKQ